MNCRIIIGVILIIFSEAGGFYALYLLADILEKTFGNKLN